MWVAAGWGEARQGSREARSGEAVKGRREARVLIARMVGCTRCAATPVSRPDHHHHQSHGPATPATMVTLNPDPTVGRDVHNAGLQQVVPGMHAPLRIRLYLHQQEGREGGGPRGGA